MTVTHHSLPSPEYTGDSDSDSDVIHELEQKRRQLDEEVARFRAQKDKEFRDFETEVKASRRQRRAQQSFHRNNATNYYEFTNNYQFTKNSPSATPPSVSTLSGCEKKIRSPQNHHGYRQSEPIKLMKATGGLKATPPTICLDKTNIKGESIPQSHANPLQTPPTPTNIPSKPSGSQNHAPSNTAHKDVSSDTTSIQPEPLRAKPPISPDNSNHNQALVRLFVPPYLPSLGAQTDRNVLERPIEGIQTEPASPVGRTISIESMAIQASSLPTESSMTDSLHMPTTRRAYTSPPVVNRRHLPPIIRNVNGRRRASGKRKHVTFQLADRAIVEPSSSYEEGPSPDINDDSSGTKSSNESILSTSSQEQEEESHRPKTQRRNIPRDPLGRRKRDFQPMSTPDSEIGMSMGDLLLGGDLDSAPVLQIQTQFPHSPEEEEGYFSPRHGHHSPVSQSPEKPKTPSSSDEDVYISKRKTPVPHPIPERQSSRSPNKSPSPPQQPSLDESGAKSSSSNKLKSPHFSPRHSPPQRPSRTQQYYPGKLEDDLFSTNTNVGFFELDEELDSPTSSTPRPDLPEDKDDDLSLGQMDTSGMRLNSEYGFPKESQTRLGTSVPIDIVRPGSMSNSWVGTFGH